MSYSGTDPQYLNYQYSNAEKLRIRYQTHELYSENKTDFQAWVLGHLELEPGMQLLDVGCGPGKYHLLLKNCGVKIAALDYSAGMVQEVIEQAAREELPVVAFRGDAQQLPLASASFERVMANHMLYHVPDKLAALREMRRVLKPSGRVVISTNAKESSALLRQIFYEAAEACGYEALKSSEPFADFGLHQLDLVQEVFPNARLAIYEDAFVFPDAAAPIRYWATGMVDAISDAPADNSHRAPILAEMQTRIEKIIEVKGVFRVPKYAGSYIAEI